MALNMENADFARSGKGVENFKNIISEKIAEIKNELSEKKLDNFEKELKKIWVGSDEEKFISSLKAKAASASECLKEIETKINDLIDTDSKQFNKFQENNDILSNN